MTDKLLNFGLALVGDPGSGEKKHDPAMVVEALQRVLEVTCLLEKKYRAKLDRHLQALPSKARTARKAHLQDARDRANRAAEAYQNTMAEELRKRRDLKL